MIVIPYNESKDTSVDKTRLVGTFRRRLGSSLYDCVIGGSTNLTVCLTLDDNCITIVLECPVGGTKRVINERDRNHPWEKTKVMDNDCDSDLPRLDYREKDFLPTGLFASIVFIAINLRLVEGNGMLGSCMRLRV